MNAGKTEIADNLEEITVLFADQFGIEKIKTIGDCYMALSNLIEDRVEATFCMVEFALAALARLDELRPTLNHPFHIRIGISVGPAIAGVLRGKRSMFDVWGDTVNTASRYESSGVPNRIHLSKPVADRIKESYALEERPAIDLRGKGSMPSFFLGERFNQLQPLCSAVNGNS